MSKNLQTQTHESLKPEYLKLHQSPQLPETGFCKLWQIVGDKKRHIPAVLPVSRTTFLNRVKDGTYPQPVKLGVRSVAWRVQDIRALLAEIGG